MKRTRLAERILPDYTKGEEIMNAVTHSIGAILGVLILVLCIMQAVKNATPMGITGAAIYGSSMIVLYTISSVYHGLHPCIGKKVLQVIDHCTIYILIAGTYTPIVLCAICPLYPVLGWSMFALEWGLAALCITLTAVDLKKYKVFSMICYIGMGWAILPFARQTEAAIGKDGFAFLLAGGIAYTIGAILYGIGARKHWMHSIFHIFVVLGSLLQFLAIYFYVLI